MRVSIDISALEGGHSARGIGTYTRCLTEALYDLKDGNKYILTTKPNKERVDVIHYPFFDFFFLTLPMRNTAPTVVTVHDVIPLLYPDRYPPGLRGKFKLWMQLNKLKRADAIITDSDTSKEDVIKLMDIEGSRVHRVYLAASNATQCVARSDYATIMKKYDLKRPYFLYVGDINYNKNLSGLVEAYSQFSDQMDLVLVSRAMKEQSIEAVSLRKLIKSLNLEANIHILSNVPSGPENDLCSLYSGASWYVQPSLYEGFGLPVLEAMQCKTPVISSIGGSLKEVAGEAAITFDPKIEGSLKMSMNKALKMTEKERGELIDRGIKRARKYSWEKTAKNTVDIYEKVMEKSR